MTAPDAIATIEAEAGEIATEVVGLKVTDQESFVEAAGILVEVKTRLKVVEAERKKIAGPLYQAWKASNDFFTRVSSRLLSAELELKGKVAAYHDLARKREAAAIAALATATDHAGSAMALVAASAPVVKGVATKSVLDWSVEDSSLVPDAYWVLDEKRIGADVRAGAQIPGIRTVMKTSVAVTGRAT